MKKTIKQYVKEVKKHLVASPMEKMAMLADLKEHLFDSYCDKSELTLELLYEDFGEPEEIANSFFDARDLSKFRKQAKAKTIITFSACVVAVIAICTAIFVLCNDNSNSNTTIKNYQTETIYCEKNSFTCSFNHCAV